MTICADKGFSYVNIGFGFGGNPVSRVDHLCSSFFVFYICFRMNSVDSDRKIYISVDRNENASYLYCRCNS